MVGKNKYMYPRYLVKTQKSSFLLKSSHGVPITAATAQSILLLHMKKSPMQQRTDS